MMNPIKIAAIFIMIVAITSCNEGQSYLRLALRVIKKYSITNDTIDWKAYKAKVLEFGRDNSTIEDTYKTIRFALTELHDNHSSFIPSNEARNMNDTLKYIPQFRFELIDNTGYFKVPGFSGKGSIELAFANKLLEGIKKLDSNQLNGWIVDLRNNGGGNMWPMLLGVGPLLGNDTAGYFVNNKGKHYAWIHSRGKVLFDKQIILEADSLVILRNSHKKVAVLVNRRTGSSGEVIALSFRGLPDVKLFGENSYGLTTGNAEFKFKDGSIMNLTHTVVADRTKRKYGKKITPDIYSATPKEDALLWINGN